MRVVEFESGYAHRSLTFSTYAFSDVNRHIWATGSGDEFLSTGLVPSGCVANVDKGKAPSLAQYVHTTGLPGIVTIYHHGYIKNFFWPVIASI